MILNIKNKQGQIVDFNDDPPLEQRLTQYKTYLQPLKNKVKLDNLKIANIEEPIMQSDIPSLIGSPNIQPLQYNNVENLPILNHNQNIEQSFKYQNSQKIADFDKIFKEEQEQEQKNELKYSQHKNVKDQDILSDPEENDENIEEPQAEPMSPLKKLRQQISTLQQNNLQKSNEDSISSDSEYDQSSQNRSIQKISKYQQDLNLIQEARGIQKLLPKGVINPFGQGKQIWDMIIMLLMIYSISILPFRIAFENKTQELLGLDLTVDGLFFVDIILTFFTAYQDEKGVIIIDKKQIVIHYLKGWFVIDLTSTFPMYLIEEISLNNYNGMIRIIRLPKLYKLAKIFRIFQISRFSILERIFVFLKINQEYMLILRFVILTLIVINISGCLWFYIGTLYDDKYNWIVQNGIDQLSTFEQYITSIYFVLTVLVTVGYGNICPVNNLEYMFTIIFMYFGVVYFSYVMGTLTYTFSKIGQNYSLIKEREIFFNELAHTYSLPFSTHLKLLKCVQSSIFSDTNQLLQLFQEEPIFLELPPIVQGQICEFLFQDIVQKVVFFQSKPRDFLRKLFLHITPNFLNIGDAIYFKGEPAVYVYFVIKGRLATKCQDSKGQIRTLIHVQGSYFGDSDVLVSRARGESAIAESDAEVWKIHKDDFLKLLNEFEDVKMQVLEYAIIKEKNRKSTSSVIKNKNFLALINSRKVSQFSLTKSQLIQKVKEKIIQNTTSGMMTSSKQKNQNKPQTVFSNLDELEHFLQKVRDYEKIRERLRYEQQLILDSDQSRKQFIDNEAEETLLKGQKVFSHLQDISEYIYQL